MKQRHPQSVFSCLAALAALTFVAGCQSGGSGGGTTAAASSAPSAAPVQTASAAVPEDTGGAIVVATAGPMSGQYAAFGEQMEQGARLAVDDINAAGGVLGQDMMLVVGDDQCQEGNAASVASSLVAQGAGFVAGHFCSITSMRAGEVYQRENVLMISPASTNNAVTETGGANVFRVSGRDDQQGRIAGAYIAANYAGVPVGIVHDESAYGESLARTAEQTLRASGVTNIVVRDFRSGGSDYSGVVSALEAAGVGVVYFGGWVDDASVILRQMREVGMTAQFIGSDSLVTDEFWARIGTMAEGVLMTFGPDPRNFSTAADTVARFRASGYEPEGYTLYTYATMQVFAQAAQLAGSTSPSAMIPVLRSNTFDTVIGPVSFDAKGDVRQPAYVFYEWSNGTYAEVR